MTITSHLQSSPQFHIHLLLAECGVRTASYGPSFFPSSYDPSAKLAGHENMEEKKRGSITCRTDRANEVNKMFIIWLCLLCFEKVRTQLEVRTATYGPQIDQSQHAKSVSHITNEIMSWTFIHTVLFIC